MPPELAILADVVRYRLRRLEMANLAGAAALAVVLAVPLHELPIRIAFGVLLNLLVYLNNDWHDRVGDLAGARDRAKTEFLVAHAGAAVRAQLGLLAVLVAIAAAWGGGLWLPLVLGGGTCWAYSAVLKRRPYVDVIAMMIWGAAMPMVGVPDERWIDAMPLLVLLGLFSGVFEAIQVLRDHDADRRHGVRTTAVALGPERTTTLVRGMAVLAASYALHALSFMVAAPAILAALLPVRGVPPARLWNRMRLLCGLSFLLGCAAVWRGGA